MTDHEKMINLAKEGRTPLAMAMLEDENVRQASAERSEEYLDLVEKEKNHMPEWMWNVLWFILGAFAWASLPNSIEFVKTTIKFVNGD